MTNTHSNIPLRLNIDVSNWLYDEINKYVEVNSFENFMMHCLSKLHKIATQMQEVEFPMVRAMLARSAIEVVADAFEIYNNADREEAARHYLSYQYEKYKNLHSKINITVKSNSYNPKSRMFDNSHQDWSQKKLMARIKGIDISGDALSDYDLFSHYVHYGGSGATHVLDNGINEIAFRSINYGILFLIVMTLNEGMHSLTSVMHISGLYKGMLGQAVKYGKYIEKPIVIFSDVDESWIYPKSR